MKIKFFLLTSIILSVVGWGPFIFFSNYSGNNPIEKQSSYWLNQAAQIIKGQASNLDTAALKIGLKAYLKARKMGLDKKELLTLVDYSKPSDTPRLWVIDLKHLKVLFNTYVSHGKNSGILAATSFSNQPKSLKSSLGVFLTDTSYFGGKGYSLRVRGLEPNINNNAYGRSIVFHGASYVSPHLATSQGRIGRSFGCFALSKEIIKPIIDTIKDNTLVVAYYPDAQWLNHSQFTHG